MRTRRVWIPGREKKEQGKQGIGGGREGRERGRRGKGVTIRMST